LELDQRAEVAEDTAQAEGLHLAPGKSSNHFQGVYPNPRSKPGNGVLTFFIMVNPGYGQPPVFFGNFWTAEECALRYARYQRDKHANPGAAAAAAAATATAAADAAEVADSHPATADIDAALNAALDAAACLTPVLSVRAAPSTAAPTPSPPTIAADIADLPPSTQRPPPISLAHTTPSDLVAPPSPLCSPPPEIAECEVPGCVNARYDNGTAMCCSLCCMNVHNALLTPPLCALADCNAVVHINLKHKIVKDYCCISHARLDALRGKFTFARDGPDAAHGELSCALATCSKIPTPGCEFCCQAHAYLVVPSVAPAPLPTFPVPLSDPFAPLSLLGGGPIGKDADAETAAEAVVAGAVAAAATESMASLRASIAEVQAELVAHRFEYEDLLRRQAGPSPPPSPPQSRSGSSTPGYFSSTNSARPPPPPRGLISENTRSATPATLAAAAAAAHAASHAAAAADATDTAEVAATHATVAANAATHASDLPAVAAVAHAASHAPALDPALDAALNTALEAAANQIAEADAAAAAVATAVAATTVTNGRPKRPYPGYVYTAKEKAMKAMFLFGRITYIKREAPSSHTRSHTRAMSAMKKARPPPPPPPEAPPSPASSPKPSRPSMPPDFPPPPAPPALLHERLPAFPRPPAPATYAAPIWWAAADRVRGDMRARITELKQAILRLEEHDDRLRRAMVMHTTINRIAAHQMRVLPGEDDWVPTPEPRPTLRTRVPPPAPRVVWSPVLSACHNCSGNPVDTGNGHGPGNHLPRHCTRAYLPPTQPATGTAITVATVVAPAAAHPPVNSNRQDLVAAYRRGSLRQEELVLIRYTDRRIVAAAATATVVAAIAAATSPTAAACPSANANAAVATTARPPVANNHSEIVGNQAAIYASFAHRDAQPPLPIHDVHDSEADELHTAFV